MRQQLIDIMSGNLAGWGTVILGQPLDMIRTQLQLGQPMTLNEIIRVYKQHGLRFFYRGASSVFLSVGFITSCQFLTFELTKSFLEGSRLSPQLQLIASGCSVGLTSSLIYTPIQYAKIHTQIGSGPKGMGSARMLFHIIYQQRLKGLIKLYNGYTLSLLREGGGSALYFGSFHILMTRIGQTNREQATLKIQTLCAMVASLLYHIYSYPIDTIKTWRQSGKANLQQLVRDRIWRTRSFKVGYCLSIGRGLIIDTINLTVYENIRRLLKGLNQ